MFPMYNYKTLQPLCRFAEGVFLVRTPASDSRLPCPQPDCRLPLYQALDFSRQKLVRNALGDKIEKHRLSSPQLLSRYRLTL